MLALVGLLVAFALVVTGVALISPPAALVAAGLLIGAAALLTDFDRKGGTR